MNRVGRYFTALAICCCGPFGCRGVQPPSPPRTTDAKPSVAVSVAPAARPIFTDMSARAGIHFLEQNSKTGRKYLVETMGAGCAFIDYDGDGWPDILLLNGRKIPGGHVKGHPTMALYHNNQDGTFTDVTHAAGLDRQSLYATGIAVADYDNDGREDFYVTTALDGGHLFHNQGGGRFKDVTVQAGVGNKGNWGTSCAWVDYNRDGRLDLFVCNYVRYRSLADDQPCFSGMGNRPVYCIPSAYDTSHCILYENMGNGRFKDVSEASGIAAARGKSLGVAVWDYDGDGWPDLFVANDTVAGFLFHNLRNGKFRDVGPESGVAYSEDGLDHSGMGIEAGSPQNDGKTALLITNFYGQKTSYYRESQSGIFDDRAAEAKLAVPTSKVLGFGVLFFDYDNDGWLDIAQVNGHVQDDIESREPGTPYREPTLLFHNRQDGTYEQVDQECPKPFGIPIVGRGLAVGDYDNDGRPDLLISTNGGPDMLWRNETVTSNHWITLKLVGSRSNRDGIGAMVHVTAGGVTQSQMVRSGSSYLSASDLRAHFGLGTAKAASIEVDWPSGTTDRCSNVAADHFYRLSEGSQIFQTLDYRRSGRRIAALRGGRQSVVGNAQAARG